MNSASHLRENLELPGRNSQGTLGLTVKIIKKLHVISII